MRGFTRSIPAVMLLFASSAAAMDCASLQPVATAIEVVVDAAVEPMVEATSTGAIRGLARQQGRAEADEMVTRGLASTELQASAEFEMVERSMAGAGKCTGLNKVAVRLGIEVATIHIDSRYRPGSCEHAAVLAHEQAHVRITRQTLESWRERARAELTRALAPWRDRWRAGEMQQEVEPALDRAIAELMQQIQADGDKRHAAIDTEAAYAEVQRQCSGW